MDELKVGDWRLMDYGSKTYEWYVYRITEEKVQIGLKSWLVSSAIWIDRDEFMTNSSPVCRGKFRWWWPMLPFINDCICPFGR